MVADPRDDISSKVEKKPAWRLMQFWQALEAVTPRLKQCPQMLSFRELTDVAKKFLDRYQRSQYKPRVPKSFLASDSFKFARSFFRLYTVTRHLGTYSQNDATSPP